MKQPTPEDVRAAREAAGLSQSQAAALVHRPHYQRWHEWESGKRNMPLDTWELFLIKTGQKSGADFEIAALLLRAREEYEFIPDAQSAINYIEQLAAQKPTGTGEAK